MNRSRMPAQIIAGDSLTLALAVGAYPAADGWAVSLTLTPEAGGTPLTVSGTDGLAAWNIAVTSANSTALASGLHRYLVAAAKSGERSTIDYGQIMVLADPTASATDLRTAAKQALDAIDAVLADRATAQDMKFVFADGRTIEKIPHRDLLDLRRHYARIVARETSKGRGPKRVQMRL